MKPLARRVGVGFLVLAGSSCGAPPPPPPAPPPPPPAAPAPPPFLPGKVVDAANWLDAAALDPRRRGSAAASKATLAAWVAEFEARVPPEEVPVAESLAYASILRWADRPRGAAEQARRFLAWAPEKQAGRGRASSLLALGLADSGDHAGAEAVIDVTPIGNLASDLGREAGAFLRRLAEAHLRAGRLPRAAAVAARAAIEGRRPDTDAAALAVECWLAAGRREEAIRLAEDVLARIEKMQKSRGAPDPGRARALVRELTLLGKPAPGFATARWWKGEGGPVADESLRGAVTLVFAWDMRVASGDVFERLEELARGFAARGLRVVGVSRLEPYNPCHATPEPGMSEEEALDYCDAWVREHRVTIPLAVGDFGDPSPASWAAGAIPLLAVVGRDGTVAHVQRGTSTLDFLALGAAIERVLE